MKFKIEQIALCPRDPAAAIELLDAMGAGDWARDHVRANGYVAAAGMKSSDNEADLAFEYDMLRDAKELEVLHYTDGPNWMGKNRRVSHIGMHCEMEEVYEWRKFFAERGINVAQSVNTTSHTNPNIKDIRRYHYIIFDTYDILSVDVKLIVRVNTRMY